MNHSENPNLISDEHSDIAARDIKRGEELTCNYKDFDENYDYNMKEIFNK